MASGQIPVKRPHHGFESYEDSATHKMQRFEPAMQQPVYAPFFIKPFREMVVKLHQHLDRQDIIKMAYIMELPDTFEEDMGSLRDPLFFLMKIAEKVGRIRCEDVDVLINTLMVLTKPEAVVKIVKEYKGKYLQPSEDANVWKKATLQPDPQQKATEKDYTKYWLKFNEWCGRQNILDAKAAPCKKVTDYLISLTSSNKMNTIMNYYKGIVQHHKQFKLNDKMKLDTCIKELREQEKNAKS